MPHQDERRRWRDRQARRAAASNVVAKAVAVGARLITIPLALRVLGADRYGVWLTVSSLLNWLALYDCGLSAGLINTAATAHGQEDWRAIRHHVSTATFAAVTVACVMVAVVLLCSSWAGLPRLIGVSPGSPLAADAHSLIVSCGLLFAVSFALNCSTQVAWAIQQAHLATLFQLAATVVSCGLLVGGSAQPSSTVQFALVMACPPMVASGCLALYLFAFRYRSLLPSVRDCNRASLGAMFACGSPIFISQIADLAILYTANLLIAYRLGPGMVPSYTVPYSVLMIAGNVCYSLVAPYQAAYAEAFARRDYQWIRHTAVRLLKRNIAIVSVFGLGAALFGHYVIALWTKGGVDVPQLVLVALAIYFVGHVWNGTNGIFLIGIGCVRTKAAIQVCVAAVHVVGAWLLLPQCGIAAVPVAGLIGYLLDISISLPVGLRYLRNRETLDSQRAINTGHQREHALIIPGAGQRFTA